MGKGWDLAGRGRSSEGWIWVVSWKSRERLKIIINDQMHNLRGVFHE